MLLNIKKSSILGLALVSSSVFASVSPISANFNTITDSSGNVIQDSNGNRDNIFNEFYVEADNVTIKVSGWSDTDDMGNGNPLTGDDKITKAYDFDRNADGWSMENVDERNSGNCGYSHSADNYGANDCSHNDYDMYLIEFSEAVNLSSATYSWIGSSTSNTQVTVAALDDNSLLGKDWSQVEGNQTISSGYSQMENKGGYYSSDYSTDFTSATSNVSGTFSKYWLVGAINSIFGGNSSLEGNDGIKLSGVSFTKEGIAPPPPISVPEPTSLAIFALALAGLFASNRRKI